MSDDLDIDPDTYLDGTLYVRLVDGGIVRANVEFTKLAATPLADLIVQARSYGPLVVVKTAAEN
jgi:hypothetical protein